MTPAKPCKWCDMVNPTHWPYQCFKNPSRKEWTIKKIGKVAKQWEAIKKIWFTENPPDSNGFYYCYLGISPFCPNKLLPSEVTLDHLLPKGSHPELRNDLGDLFPCCFLCNGLKGSRSLKEALKLKRK